VTNRSYAGDDAPTETFAPVHPEQVRGEWLQPEPSPNAPTETIAIQPPVQPDTALAGPAGDGLAEPTAAELTEPMTVQPPAEPAGADPAAETRSAAATPAAGETPAPDEAEPAKLSILDQLGGLSGVVASTIPVVAFVAVNSLTSLKPAVIAALAVAVGIAVWRLVRKEPLQPAISGLFGVGVGAYVAYRTGDAKGYFLVGIWYSLVLCVVFVGSALVRWPLAGVIWHGINGDGQSWRSEPSLRRAYTAATLLWAAVFAGRFVVQRWLYDADQTFWLGAARLGMGLPLTGLALLGTVWAVRRATRYTAPA
jgi:hypothetical protein